MLSFRRRSTFRIRDVLDSVALKVWNTFTRFPEVYSLGWIFFSSADDKTILFSPLMRAMSTGYGFTLQGADKRTNFKLFNQIRSDMVYTKWLLLILQ